MQGSDVMRAASRKSLAMNSTSDLVAAIPRDEQGRPLDVIEIRQIAVNCIIGVYPAERSLPQPVELDVALSLDVRKAAATSNLGDTLDYARLVGELRFLLEMAEFHLLETAAESLCRFILAPPTEDLARVAVQAVALRLTKPEALGGAGIVSLQIRRVASEYRYDFEEQSFGGVDIIFQNDQVRIYRLRLAPGRSLVTHQHQVRNEAELVLGQGLLLQGRPVRAGTGFRWPRPVAHRFENPGAVALTVLCVQRPSFHSADEEEHDPASAPLPPEGRAYYPVAASAADP
jgi:FolB domain-containing protein